jgi:hypothetical protein
MEYVFLGELRKLSFYHVHTFIYPVDLIGFSRNVYLLRIRGITGTTTEYLHFLVDDMGWQDTSVPFWTQRTPFNDRYRTPSMERLVSEGLKFTQAYAMHVCSPTRMDSNGALTLPAQARPVRYERAIGNSSIFTPVGEWNCTILRRISGRLRI